CFPYPYALFPRLPPSLPFSKYLAQTGNGPRWVLQEAFPVLRLSRRVGNGPFPTGNASPSLGNGFRKGLIMRIHWGTVHSEGGMSVARETMSPNVPSSPAALHPPSSIEPSARLPGP